MKTEILVYTRQHCCLCEKMKQVVHPIAQKHFVPVKEIDVDGSPELKDKYTNEVPVLFINGRKAFKYRVTARALEARLVQAQTLQRRKLGSFFRRP
jgi:glutaredoxin